MVKKVDWARLLYVGGNANNGSICGLSCSNANNAFSNSNANIGSRLNFILGKIQGKTPKKTPQLGGFLAEHAKHDCNPFLERASRVTLKASSVGMKAILKA